MRESINNDLNEITDKYYFKKKYEKLVKQNLRAKKKLETQMETQNYIDKDVFSNLGTNTNIDTDKGKIKTNNIKPILLTNRNFPRKSIEIKKKFPHKSLRLKESK